MKFDFEGFLGKKPAPDALETKRLSELPENLEGLFDEHLKYLEEQHGTEGLTGLKTRAVFDKELDITLGLLSGKFEERRGNREVPTVVSLVLIDLDNFKKVNDTLGHAAGDEVLRRVSEVIRHHVRASDTAARYGGEELVILMPGATAEVAAAHAEEIRADVESLTFAEYPDLRVTGSFGVAEADQKSAGDPNQFVKRTDDALYKAKENGKNQVVID